MMRQETQDSATDSLLSQLTKEPLDPRHALHASQTEPSLCLWTMGVYECVGALGPVRGETLSHQLPLGPVPLDTVPADWG